MLPLIGCDSEDIYLTADTHFGHANIIKYCHRPFLGPLDVEKLAELGGTWHNGSWKGPKEVKYKISSEGVRIMDDALVENINRTVPFDAKLIHVGDFALSPKENAPPSAWAGYYQRCREIRGRINCRHITILWGNHDAPGVLSGLFERCEYVGKVIIEKLGISMVLAHYAHAVWDESHRGSIHCYGHTHAEIETYADMKMGGRRSMDVGVDNAYRLFGEYRPFRLQEILDLMVNREGFSFNPYTPTFYKGPREEATPQ